MSHKGHGGLHFRCEHGTLYLYRGDTMVTGYRELAFCFDADDGTRHKFGERDLVEQWHARTTQRFRDGGFAELADSLIVVSTDRWDLETINRFLDTTGYIGVWCREQQDHGMSDEGRRSAVASKDQQARSTQ